jgi:acetyl-CoA carboxylase carboxyltransferase component
MARDAVTDESGAAPGSDGERAVPERTARVLEAREAAALGGSERNRERHVAAGKMLVRDRLRMLLDRPSFEDGLLTRFEGGFPADAVVTAVGEIDGRIVCVIANDFTVKAGTWGRKTFEKITRMQRRAVELRAPLIYLIDSAGARINEQSDSFAGWDAWGNIFYEQIQLSGRIPSISAVFGPSPAGAAYLPSLCDCVIMVAGQATAYLGSPRMAEIATGEKVTLEEMGGAEMHCSVSGLGDVLVDDEEQAIASVREYLSFMPAHWEEKPPIGSALPPAAGKSIEEIVPEREAVAFDMKKVIRAFVDEGSLYEIKARFAKEIITGFARLEGMPVGLVANQSMYKAGALFPDSADKAAKFVWLCNAFNVPILFLQDLPGYMIGAKVEREGILRHGAKMLFAVAEATVPRIVVLVRKAYGGGYLAMSGSPMHPTAAIALPTAMVALMGPAAAVNAIHAGALAEIGDEDERKAFAAARRAEFEAELDVVKVADQNAIDAVVPGSELRGELVERLTAYRRLDAPRQPRRNGVYPV